MKNNEKVFKVHAVRTVDAPSNPRITSYYVWVEFQDLPNDFSLEVNPRKPKMTTSVAKQLVGAVTSPTGYFELNNRGIVITAKKLKYDTNTRKVTLDMGEDVSSYGILDGGHTYRAIIENREKLDSDIKKYVKLEILIGEELDVASIADARNTSAQVSDIALFELDNKFEFIKDALKDQPYLNDIAYKDNENKRIPIIEVLKLLFALNVKKYPDDSSAPVSAYSGKANVFKDFRKELEIEANIESKVQKKQTLTEDEKNNINIYKALSPEIPLIVELYEKIEQDLPEIYTNYKKEEGKVGRFGAVRGVNGSKSGHKTLFNEEVLTHDISQGFLLPILGSFRALIELEDGKLKWSFNPLEVWDDIAIRLVQNTFDTETNPQMAGKNKTLWQSNYRIVDSHKKDLFIKELMSNK